MTACCCLTGDKIIALVTDDDVDVDATGEICWVYASSAAFMYLRIVLRRFSWS